MNKNIFIFGGLILLAISLVTSFYSSVKYGFCPAPETSFDLMQVLITLVGCALVTIGGTLSTKST